VFCSWGAEEYGLIGSTEWVEVCTSHSISASSANRSISQLEVQFKTNQDHQALLKAKYSSRVAEASCTQKNTKQNM